MLILGLKQLIENGLIIEESAYVILFPHFYGICASAT